MAGLTLTADERVEALERRCADAEFAADVERCRRWKLESDIAALQGRKITLDDLPLAALMRKLELNWHPSANVLLEPGSITADLLADELRTPKAVA